MTDAPPPGGRLTTHVLDTMHGRPAADMSVRLVRTGMHDLGPERFTNADGRLDEPLLEGETMQTGSYELHFGVGRYFRRGGVATGEPAFLEDVVIRFGIDDPSRHLHVPLLVSPYGYATYRGS